MVGKERKPASQAIQHPREPSDRETEVSREVIACLRRLNPPVASLRSRHRPVAVAIALAIHVNETLRQLVREKRMTETVARGFLRRFWTLPP